MFLVYFINTEKFYVRTIIFSMRQVQNRRIGYPDTNILNCTRTGVTFFFFINLYPIGYSLLNNLYIRTRTGML